MPTPAELTEITRQVAESRMRIVTEARIEAELIEARIELRNRLRVLRAKQVRQ